MLMHISMQRMGRGKITIYRITRNFHGRKLSRLHGKLLFRHKTFAVAHDGPKDYASDGDY